jgi:hypothetical protein
VADAEAAARVDEPEADRDELEDEEETAAAALTESSVADAEGATEMVETWAGPEAVESAELGAALDEALPEPEPEPVITAGAAATREPVPHWTAWPL